MPLQARADNYIMIIGCFGWFVIRRYLKPITSGRCGPNVASQMTKINRPSIPLPKDHGETVIVICRAVHYRTDDISENSPMDTLVYAAVFCDKYDTSRALRMWSSI